MERGRPAGSWELGAESWAGTWASLVSVKTVVSDKSLVSDKILAPDKNLTWSWVLGARSLKAGN